jgi:hypothetical protein
VRFRKSFGGLASRGDDETDLVLYACSVGTRVRPGNRSTLRRYRGAGSSRKRAVAHGTEAHSRLMATSEGSARIRRSNLERNRRNASFSDCYGQTVCRVFLNLTASGRPGIERRLGQGLHEVVAR